MSSTPTSTVEQLTQSTDDGAVMGKVDSLNSFFGSDPVVKQTGCVVPTDLATAITAITVLRTALNNLGLTTVET